MSKDSKKFNKFGQVAELLDEGVFCVGQMINGVLRFRLLTKAGFVDQFVSSVTSLETLSDVDVENLQDGQFLIYDLASQKWKNASVDLEQTLQKAYDGGVEILVDNSGALKLRANNGDNTLNLLEIKNLANAITARIQGDGKANFAGVRFGSDTLDANTLDDYEEGTWTPTLQFSISTGTIGYAERVGRYTKIGDMVFIQMNIRLNEYTGANSGLNSITGLPFLPRTGDDFVFSCFYAGVVNFDGIIGARIDSSNGLRVVKVGANSISVNESNAFSNSFQLRFSACYKVN